MNGLKATAAPCGKPGLEADDKLVFQSGSTIEDGTNAALQMLNEGCNATAVQAVSDLVAIGCANAMLSQGLKIPGDISIVGFGNILAAEYFQRAAHDHPPAKTPAGCRGCGDDDGLAPW